ncbi:MAG TPA: fructosamine kinase family protein [Steroidobacteraceae bacterium]|nr:fructosamine kinase family protein [Steroidobacteraceae bacterium]
MLAERLGQITGRRFAPAPAEFIRGGSVHRCVRWDTDAGPTFVKIASRAQHADLEAEAVGLAELAAARALRVPRVLAIVTHSGESALALEWIEFGAATARAEADLGRRLAVQHRVTSPRCGWSRHNTIGRTPQRNDWPDDDWVRFYAERRLRPQLSLAANAGLPARVVERGERLAAGCGAFFAGRRPAPSLLHGDLWGGNWAVVAGRDEPVVFDPAVYFGDREADLAMTRLFGGFGRAFYEAYASEWPLDAGAEARVALYNLYHVLNHWNLFGGGYGAEAAGMIDRLLADL